MLYIFIIVYCLFCIIQFDVREGKKTNYIHYWLIFAILTVMSSIQYRMGADILTYMTEYDYYNNDLSLNYLFGFTTRRPLWVLSVILFKYSGFSFVVFKTAIAIFVNFVMAKFFYKRVKYKYFVLLMYFLVLYFHFNFNILRNAIAICFFLLSYSYLEKNKYIPYILLNIIGLGFHEAIVLPAILSLAFKFVNLEKNTRFIIGLLAVAGIAIPLLPSGIRDMLQLISVYYDVGVVGERAVGYLNKDSYSDFSLTIFGYLEWMIKLAFFFYIFLQYTKKKQNSSYLAPLTLYLILTIFNNALPILYRIAEFYTPFYLICITYVVQNDKIAKISIPKTMIMLLMVFYVHTFFLFLGGKDKELYQYYPYTSIIDHQTVPEREKLYSDKEMIEFIR